MAGILDMDPQQQGILQAAFAMMNASGPSRMPVSVGQVLGQGGMAGIQGYEQAQQAQMRNLQAKKLATDLAIEQSLFGGDQAAAGGSGIIDSNDPGKLRLMGTRLAAAGHQGGAALLNLADREDIRKQNQQRLTAMKSGDNGEGLFGPLTSSPYVGEDAKRLQAQVNSEGPTANPDDYLRRFDALSQAHRTMQERENARLQAQAMKPEEALVPVMTPDGPRLLPRSQAVGKVPATAGAVADAVPADLKDYHGADYLEKLPTGRAGLVKAVAEGKQSLNSASMRYGNKQVLAEQVQQYDPTYNKAREGVWKEFTSAKPGTPGGNVVAINTTIAHSGTLYELSQALQNKDLKAQNRLTSFVRDQLNDPRINNAELATQALSNELMRVFRQVQASEQETKQFESRLNAGVRSPQAMKEALQTGIKLLDGRLDELKSQWDRSMDNKGRKEAGLPPIDFEVLSDKSKATLSKLGVVKQGVPLTVDQSAAAGSPLRRKYNPSTGAFE